MVDAPDPSRRNREQPRCSRLAMARRWQMMVGKLLAVLAVLPMLVATTPFHHTAWPMLHGADAERAGLLLADAPDRDGPVDDGAVPGPSLPSHPHGQDPADHAHETGFPPNGAGGWSPVATGTSWPPRLDLLEASPGVRIERPPRGRAAI